MSLFGSMKTAVSGMNAQANRLSTVADNIANANTTGYKSASTSFASMVLPSTAGNYNSGGVQTSVRRAISDQGDLSFTTSQSDLAISGDGFFIVQSPDGIPVLTRAGDFTKDRQGNLVNAAGFTLMGYSYGSGSPAVVVNGFDGLVPVNLSGGTVTVVPTTQGVLGANLPADAPPKGGTIINSSPADNGPFSGYTQFTQLTDAFGPLGDTKTDLYFTKLDDNQWEITAFADWAGTSSGFPYDLASGDVSMRTTTLTFDPATGALISGNPVLDFQPDDPSVLDFSNFSQSAGSGSPATTNMRWNMPSDIPEIDIAGGDQPASSNSPASLYTVKETVNSTFGQGSNQLVDMYLTKVGPWSWELAAYDNADATAGGFPYSSAALATMTLNYDPGTGELTGPSVFNIPLPDGSATYPIDFAGSVSIPDMTPGWVDRTVYSQNLDPAKTVVTPTVSGGQTAGQNVAGSSYTEKTSIVARDLLGSPVQLDVFFTKVSDQHWEVAVFDHSRASSGGFPYGVAGSAPLSSTVLSFDDRGKLMSGDSSLSLQAPNGDAMTLDLSGTIQLASKFSVLEADINGRAASQATGYKIDSDGTVYVQNGDGSAQPLYRIPLATVASPDRLTVLSGNVYAANGQSGVTVTGFPQTSGYGKLQSGALESSNVDLAGELTEMIESQRSYTANSKVFQTGADLMDVLITLKR